MNYLENVRKYYVAPADLIAAAAAELKVMYEQAYINVEVEGDPDGSFDVTVDLQMVDVETGKLEVSRTLIVSHNLVDTLRSLSGTAERWARLRERVDEYVVHVVHAVGQLEATVRSFDRVVMLRVNPDEPWRAVVELWRGEPLGLDLGADAFTVSDDEFDRRVMMMLERVRRELTSRYEACVECPFDGPPKRGRW